MITTTTAVKRAAITLLALAALLAVGLLVADEPPPSRFPNPENPDPRVGTPQDPRFDCAEPDNEDIDRGGDWVCTGDLFGQQVNLFGFAPAQTRDTALYRDAARFGEPQISGVKADIAWKTTIGVADVVVAVMDTGMDWSDERIRSKVFLNCGELPAPQDASGGTQAGDSPGCREPNRLYDLNGNGHIDVDDYADDPRVGRRLGDGRITGADLIDAFSDGVDHDGNGYIDDISGWDFFEDNNDPEDTTSYSSSGNHGRGRMREAAEVTDNERNNAGVCPNCRVLPLRIWDTFVSPADTWAAATVYATDVGALVHVAAIGMLQNTRAAMAANRYAYDNGVALMHVSSDLNTANHNYPTNYVESVFINGCVADTWGLSDEFFDPEDLGQIPGVGDLLAGIVPGGAAAPVLTWFRQSNLTQHGAHAHVCYVGDTGSNATGQAGGGAGLIHSRGIELADQIGGRLSANEVKQILTLSAEDVLPENTIGIGAPNPTQEGWSEHFGYGRADLGAAVQRVGPDAIPPEALIERPAWWHLFDPEGEAPDSSDFRIFGTARALRAAGCNYRLEWAAGIEPPNDGFTSFAQGGCPTGTGSMLGELPIEAIANAVEGSRSADFGSGPGRPDVNRFAFTVRLVVEDNHGNIGEDRKAWFVIHDPGWLPGWPRFPDTGGETSLTLYDLNGDGRLEVIDATSAGELCVYQHDGSFAPWFNSGDCWRLSPTWFVLDHLNAPGFASGAVPLPTSGLRTPAVADLEGDFLPEIVVAASDGRVFVLRANGEVRLELGINPALSTPDKRSRGVHPKRGILGSPVLADLDGDGNKDIIVAALDGHIYVWGGATGTQRPGFPLEVREDPAPGNLSARGELITAPAIGDITGDGKPNIVIGSSDVVAESSPPDLTAGINDLVGNLAAEALGGESRIYAFHADGSLVANWPVAIPGLLPDILPMVGPQHAVTLADFSGDGVSEVVASITTSDVHVITGDGSKTVLTSQGVVQGGATPEATRVLNLFEYSAVGDLHDQGRLNITKVGVSAAGAVNLLLVGQNLPFNHVVQAWDPEVNESYLPGFPVAHDDYGLLSTPAIARVADSPVPGRQIVAGSGLYLIQAYDALGQRAPGFPKFAGGWLFGVPTFGDVNGDGNLNLAATTREGWRFVWNLDVADTPDNNSEWWTEGHDECRSWNYATDCRPPSPVQGLEYDGEALVFTAPGDNFMSGRVDRYELRTLDRPIVTLADWEAAAELEARPATVDGRQTERLPLALELSAGHVAIQPVDAAGNRARFVSTAVGEDVEPPVEFDGSVAPLGFVQSSGGPGDVVGAGGFILANSSTQPHTLRSVSIALSQPIAASVTIRGAGGNNAVATPAGSNNELVFDTPVTLAPGADATFSVELQLNDNGSASLSWINTAHAASGIAAGTGGGLLLLGLALCAPWRWRGLALVFVLLLAGCRAGSGGDALPGTPSEPSTIATVSLTALDVRDADGTPLNYEGLPPVLAEVTRTP